MSWSADSALIGYCFHLCHTALYMPFVCSCPRLCTVKLCTADSACQTGAQELRDCTHRSHTVPFHGTLQLGTMRGYLIREPLHRKNSSASIVNTLGVIGLCPSNLLLLLWSGLLLLKGSASAVSRAGPAPREGGALMTEGCIHGYAGCTRCTGLPFCCEPCWNCRFLLTARLYENNFTIVWNLIVAWKT